MPDSSSRAIRISGSHNDIDYWRRRFKARPIVSLNGVEITGGVIEARSGAFGYVVTEIVGTDGRPQFGAVVLPDGRVVGKVIASVTRHGVVSIHGEEWPRAERGAS